MCNERENKVFTFRGGHQDPSLHSQKVEEIKGEMSHQEMNTNTTHRFLPTVGND